MFEFKMNAFKIPSVPVENQNKYCRLCLTICGDLSPLFPNEEVDTLAVSLSMRVSLCTAINISKHDNLPQKICQSCLKYVNDWYLFRKKCRMIDSLLKEKLVQSQHSGNVENADVQSNEDSVFIQSDGIKELQSRKKKHKCSICPDSFYFSKDLKLHKITIHNHTKPEYSKQVLPIPESDIKLDGINMRTRYEMKCCNKVFFSKLRFRKHYNEKHPGEKPFMCETCGKKDFISEETLKRHKILHTGKFRCNICNKTFTCNAILILHKRDKHENDKPFICDVCGKRFVTELLMNYHKRFHTGEKKYVCEECGLAVVTSSSLAKHKRIHSQEKPHVCHVCGKGFIIKGRLVEHLRVHTGERPYSCQVCQKGFTMRDKLKRHMRVHSGEKPFSCEYCGNTYSTKYGLYGHLNTHLGKYP